MPRHKPEVEPRDKFVGIWIRVSTEDQAKGESPEHHERRARMYAESRGWHVREVYHLEGVSGKAVREHPEAQRMMRDVASGRISGLVFSKLARLARSTRDLLDFADYFRDHEADLISLQESIDTTSPAGRLFYTLIAAMAQWEREEISDRVAASVPIRAKLGKPTGGQAPYGYQWHDRQLVPRPEEAAVRKRMYELFLEHRRKKVVARLLNEMGHRTRSGAEFSDTTVDRLLRDPLAKGLRRANYTKSLGEKKHWKYKPENEWVFSKAEPIVSEELWGQANAILEQQRENGRRVAKRPVQLFAGFTYCACGQRMYVPSDSPKYVCTKCRNKIPIADLEAVFEEQLKNFVFSPEEIAQYLKQADETIKAREEQLQTLAQEERRVRQEMDKVYRAYVDDEISVEGFGRVYRPLEERLKQLEEEIPRLQGELDFLKIQYLSRDEVLDEARNLQKRWPNLSHEDKRQVIENIVDRITIGKDEVAIDLCYLPSSSETAAKKQRKFTVALPFCGARLTGRKPLPATYPKQLNTVGDHLRKRRLELDLRQRDVAKRLGVDETTIANWELNHTAPALGLIPRIIRFLGYSPLRASGDLPARLRAFRKAHGLSQKALAALLGVDPATVLHWERGASQPNAKHLAAIDHLAAIRATPCPATPDVTSSR